MSDVSYSFNETLRVPFDAYYTWTSLKDTSLQLTLLAPLIDRGASGCRMIALRARRSFARSCRTRGVHPPFSVAQLKSVAKAGGRIRLLVGRRGCGSAAEGVVANKPPQVWAS